MTSVYELSSPIAPAVATVAKQSQQPQDCRIQVIDSTTVEVVDVSSIPTGTILIDQLDIPSEANDYDNIKFKDVIITDEATNLASNRSSSSTRLKSIMGVPVVLLSTDKLRLIAGKLGVKGHRK